MITCANGHANADGHVYCAQCGVLLRSTGTSDGQGVAADAGRSRRRRWVLVGAGAVVLVVIGVAVALAGGDGTGRRGAGPDVVVLSEPTDRGGRLSIGRLEDPLSDFAEFALDSSVLSLPHGPVTHRPLVSPPPRLVPSDEGAMVLWTHGANMTLAVLRPGEDDPKILVEADTMEQVLLDPGEQHYLVEARASDGESMTCSTGAVGRAPSWSISTDDCLVHRSGRVVSLASENPGQDVGTPTYRATTRAVDGAELGTFTAEGRVSFSAAGGRVAATTDREIVVFDSSDGSTVGRVVGPNLLPLGWAEQAEVLLVGRSVEDSAVLTVIGEDGEPDDVLAGPAVIGEITPDGSTVIGASTDGREVTVSRIDVASGETTTLATADDLEVRILGEGDEPGLLAWSFSEDSLWFGSAASGALEQVGSLDGLEWLGQIGYDESRRRAIFPASDGEEANQLVAVDADGVDRVLTGASVDLIEAADGKVLAVRREEQSAAPTLVVVEGDDVREIDGDGWIENAELDGSRVLYSWSERSGDPMSEHQVRVVDLEGDGGPEVLQDRRNLGGRVGARPAPWSTPGGSGGEVLWIEWNPECPIDDEMGNVPLSGGAYESGELLGEAEQYCLAVPSDRRRFSVTVWAQPGVTVTLTDAAGEEVRRDEIGPEAKLEYEVVLDRGVYDLTLEPSSDDEFVPYSLEFVEQ